MVLQYVHIESKAVMEHCERRFTHLQHILQKCEEFIARKKVSDIMWSGLGASNHLGIRGRGRLGFSSDYN
jgi:fructoselysine-6-P-deglycase FrlB-like protein